MSIRTDEDRVSAVESMFRIRAVESPPDQFGVRTIWHRGLKGAELVSDVDGSGRVTRQELALFDDVIVWSEGQLKTGEMRDAAKRPRPSDELVFDDRPRDERLDRVSRALKKYRGSDRFIQHVRDVLGVSDDAVPLIDEPITRSSAAVREESVLAKARAREIARQAERRKLVGLIGVIAGGLLVALGLLLLWQSMSG
jgi:hypothetical protein